MNKRQKEYSIKVSIEYIGLCYCIENNGTFKKGEVYDYYSEGDYYWVVHNYNGGEGDQGHRFHIEEDTELKIGSLTSIFRTFSTDIKLLRKHKLEILNEIG